jgi:predicted permease
MKDRLLQLLRRFQAFFSSEALDRELNAEMAAHLELAIEDNLQRGMSAEEARRQALIRFGPAVSAREQHREARGLPFLETLSQNLRLDVLLQDLRYALRTLRGDRVFTLIAVLILALGVAANVAVFSVVNTLLLRPLPFPDPQQLAWLAVGNGEGGLSAVTYTVEAYQEFQRQNESFQQITCYNPFLGNSETKLLGRGEPQPVAGLMIGGSFFQTLGVEPAVGRLFLPEECQKGGRPAVILSHPFWQRQFGGDPAIVGQAITLDTTNVTVVGVLPPSFDFGSVFWPGVKMDVYTPAPLEDMRDWGNTLALVGRLKPGVTVAQAQAEANVLFPQLRAAHPEWYMDYSSTITQLKDHVSGKLHRSLVVLWCAVGLILLIVCVNLSNLLLGRAAARSKEFALRSALGAGRGRLVRQLLTESLVLSAVGALVGLGLAFATLRYLSHQGSIALPLLSSVSLDRSAIGWTVLIAVVAAALFGLAPGLKMSAGSLQDALKDSGHGLTAGRKGTRLRAVLVVSEMALACVLLVGAGLLLRSFLRVLDVDLGFEASRAAVIKVDYDDGGNMARRGAILQEMLQRVSAIPGIESAGITDMLPLDRNRSWGFEAKGKIYSKEELNGAFIRIVTPGYIRAMGMRLVAGRDFDWHDTGDSDKVVVINQAAARRHWPDEDPIGRMAYGIGRGESKVIGVIADVRQNSLEEAATPEVFAPILQQDPEGAELVVRTGLPPETLTPSVMSALRALNPNQPAAELRPVQRLVDHATSPRRFFVLLVTLFAALGLVLAALGIYGVISYSVTRQTQEIGIRRALGATAGQVQRSIIAKTLRLALAGVALGTIGSFIAARWIAAMLFGTQPTDPVTFAAIVVLLCAAALVAGYIPARRASGIDPMIALRGD